ncbi:antitoxin [Agromyces bauzanensis]|uniref:Antitoxin n=1 Tax=Agromyces bauzanensis TaxID=1308924 RepID=A0A917UPB9_9MICO|nr:antitoxin [Agromyces bauzanensis]GGJ72236.1 antitoxin [Agromyces bauzanensis]
MRTTITLTPDADALVRRVMRERGLSFKDAVNFAIVAGLAPAERGAPVETPTFDLGHARLPLDRATALAAELEDEQLLRKREQGK